MSLNCSRRFEYYKCSYSNTEGITRIYKYLLKHRKDQSLEIAVPHLKSECLVKRFFYKTRHFVLLPLSKKKIHCVHVLYMYNNVWIFLCKLTSVSVRTRLSVVYRERDVCVVPESEHNPPSCDVWLKYYQLSKLRNLKNHLCYIGAIYFLYENRTIKYIFCFIPLTCYVTTDWYSYIEMSKSYCNICLDSSIPISKIYIYLYLLLNKSLCPILVCNLLYKLTRLKVVFFVPKSHSPKM